MKEEEIDVALPKCVARFDSSLRCIDQLKVYDISAKLVEFRGDAFIEAQKTVSQAGKL